MDIGYRVQSIKDESDWSKLAEALGGGNIRAVRSILRHLRSLYVVSYIVEERYIDRDYSSDYRHFYSQTFKQYGRLCKRVHFFSSDVRKVWTKKSWSERCDLLKETSGKSYRGFCVVRPVEAPIGRAILSSNLSSAPGKEVAVTTRARYRANLLGAELELIGTAFMQQDQRVGACAQVAIWAAARHLHQRYRYGWYSVADITTLALPSVEEAGSLPAGASSLAPEPMVRAIKGMGYQCLYMEKQGDRDLGKLILPYVESGLPVIVGLAQRNELGHAVTVVGRSFQSLAHPSSEASDYVSSFIVHDDQAGPYMLLPRKPLSAREMRFEGSLYVEHLNSALKPVHFNLKQHGALAIVPMPAKVFCKAEEAEVTAAGTLAELLERIEVARALIRREDAENARLLDDLFQAHAKRQIVLRTYLTSAAGYRRHVAAGTAADRLKGRLLNVHLPHFTWVTEIATVGSYNHVSAGLRRIYGHVVIDATSNGKDKKGVLIIHVPGVVFVRNEPGKQPEERGTVIPNDRLYECREKRLDH